MSTNGKMKLIARKVLFALADLKHKTVTAVASANGTYAERIKDHKELSNLNSKMAGWLFWLDGLDPDKRNYHLGHFDAMRVMFEQDRWKDQPQHVGDMFDEMAADEEIQRAAAEAKEKAAEQQQKDNVHRLQTGIKKLPDDETGETSNGKGGRKGAGAKAAATKAAAKAAKTDAKKGSKAKEPATIGGEKKPIKGMPSAPVDPTLN